MVIACKGVVVHRNPAQVYRRHHHPNLSLLALCGRILFVRALTYSTDSLPQLEHARKRFYLDGCNVDGRGL